MADIARMNEKQLKEARKLIKKRCCNYDQGSCIVVHGQEDQISALILALGDLHREISVVVGGEGGGGDDFQVQVGRVGNKSLVDAGGVHIGVVVDDADLGSVRLECADHLHLLLQVQHVGNAGAVGAGLLIVVYDARGHCVGNRHKHNGNSFFLGCSIRAHRAGGSNCGDHINAGIRHIFCLQIFQKLQVQQFQNQDDQPTIE